MSDKEGLLDAADVAAILGVRARTVRAWSRRGVFTPPVRLGRHGRSLRWRRTDVEEFVTRTRQVCAEPR